MAAVDLFGMPIGRASAPSRIGKTLTSIADVLLFREKRAEVQKAKFQAFLKEAPIEPLFDDLFEVLMKPLAKLNVPSEFAFDPVDSDVRAATDEVPEAEDTVAIPYVSWGQPLVMDANELSWSHEGLVYLQTKLLWRSFEELCLEHNPMDKWDALKWIFRPMVWKEYCWDKKLGRSVCFETHQRTLPFSFHNCCIAARMDPDALREGVRRNLPQDVLTAVDRVMKFD